MKKHTRSLALFLCILLLMLLPSGANALTLTAVDDVLLPLQDATMPLKLGSELYVPYSVFSMAGVDCANEGDTLRLSHRGKLLHFSAAEGSVYDETMLYYPLPAYPHNDTIYVPVKLCCGHFGLGYSTLNVAEQEVLRITAEGAQNDDSFILQKEEQIRSMVDAYEGKGAEVPTQPTAPPYTPPAPAPAPAPVPAVPSTPVQPREPVIPDAKLPNRVILAYFEPAEGLFRELLDTLKKENRQATFLLSPTEAWNEGLVRRAAAEGHSIGFVLPAGNSQVLHVLSSANQRLFLQTGLQTRLLTFEQGDVRETQRLALQDAGYRLWQPSLDSGDRTLSPEKAYTDIVTTFSQRGGRFVLALHSDSACTVTLTGFLLNYLARNDIDTTPLLEADAL